MISKTRMQRVDRLYAAIPRMVRDLSRELGKKVVVDLDGGDVEMDREMIEMVGDPLTHIVRNALDHGLEPPADRIAADKPEVGRLNIVARQSGNQIVIEVADDGRGMDRAALVDRAVAAGLVTAAEAAGMSDAEKLNLIFLPGLSTAREVTSISGRGVGMDVVRRNIQDMGGHVKLYSEAGKGTRTQIILPLTLAILDGMSVRVGSEVFILPLNHVTESIQPQLDQIHSVAGNERVIQVRGEYLPLVELHRTFSVSGAQEDPSQAIAVIMHAQERRFALLVDHLIGQHQVVVKNLEANYRKVPGISAATILGDGSVALIIDVFAMARSSGRD